jgi:hypothetical protein
MRCFLNLLNLLTHFPTAARQQRSIHLQIDAVINPPHRAIAGDEMHAARMVAAEIVEVVLAVIRRVIAHAHDADRACRSPTTSVLLKPSVMSANRVLLRK